MVHGEGLMVMNRAELVEMLKVFMENEARSCRLSPHFDTLTSKILRILERLPVLKIHSRKSSTFFGVMTRKEASGYVLANDSGTRTLDFLSFHLNSYAYNCSTVFESNPTN